MGKSHTVVTTVLIHLQNPRRQGEISVKHGQLEQLKVVRGPLAVTAGRYKATQSGPCVLSARISSLPLQAGAQSPVVQVQAGEVGFSFFLRDVNSPCPIFIPAFGAAITPEKDTRSYEDLERDIRAKGLQTRLQQVASQPEESYEEASRHTRNLVCPTWLGLPRDVRMFELNLEYEGEWDHYIVPKFHNTQVKLPELDDQPVRHNFMIGRGIGVTREITRCLEEGSLPIVQIRVIDEEMRYDALTFVSLEKAALSAKTLKGTHHLVADSCHFGTRLTDEQRAIQAQLADGELHQDDETVLYFRCVATNSSAAPRYAYFRSVVAAKGASWTAPAVPVNGVFPSGRVYAVSKFNGQPMPQEEMAVLLLPGESCTFEFFLPHEPISAARAAALRKQDFEKRHQECRRFWQEKLASAGQIRLPEQRIQEMLRAGLLHIDLITHGQEPDGPLGINVGRYGPIGSESSTIGQYLESVGWHDVVERSIRYFLEKQRPDGFIQNYENFMLETGPVLWNIGQHLRYTQDKAFIRRIKPNILKACEYLWDWHKRNCLDELRGRGYGLLEGKVADPEDAFRVFMLNGYAVLGLQRAAEALEEVDPEASRKIAQQAKTLRQYVREAFFQAVGRSPVAPLCDGTWVPTAGPWAEATGPVCMYADVFNAYTHGTFVGRDSLIGPNYLLFQEVLAPDEPAADWLMNFHADVMTVRNAAFSEPYYDPYLYIHLLRGEVKAFLKGYYNTFSALGDRQTYSFWEHLFQASPHKTSEEAWFMMQTRWMLYLEQGDTLRLLAGAPRAWLEQGKKIELENMASHFGKLDLAVESNVEQGVISATIQCPGRRRPKAVRIRLPHPQSRRAVHVTGGTYDPATESVLVQPFTGKANVELRF